MGTEGPTDPLSQGRTDRSAAVLVQAGPFLFGPDKRRAETGPFYMGRWPVTNADYAEFVVASEHRPPKHWGGFAPDVALASHPVVEVSWHDAVAYAAWAGGRLPTAAEWEKAARGTGGRLYPWGDEFDPGCLAASESGADGTRSVDAFPAGASPYGVECMAGNTWEWTATLLGDEGEWRVLKGGAWDYKGERDARCAAFAYYEPTFRHPAVGFRMAWDP